MTREVAEHGALPDSGRFGRGQLRPGLQKRLGGEIRGRQSRDGVGLGELVVGQQCVGAEVGHNAVGRAPAAGRVAYGALCRAEEALQLVGGRRDPGVVEAVEQVRPVAGVPSGEVIDKTTRGCTEPVPRSFSDQRLQVFLKPALRLRRRGGAVRTVRGRGQLASDGAQDLGVALDAAGGSGFVPRRYEGLVELVEQRPPGAVSIRRAFFFSPRPRRYGSARGARDG